MLIGNNFSVAQTQNTMQRQNAPSFGMKFKLADEFADSIELSIKDKGKGHIDAASIVGDTTTLGGLLTSMFKHNANPENHVLSDANIILKKEGDHIMYVNPFTKDEKRFKIYSGESDEIRTRRAQDDCLMDLPADKLIQKVKNLRVTNLCELFPSIV